MSDNHFPDYTRPSYKTRQQPSGESTPTRSRIAKEPPDDLLSYYSTPRADESRDYSPENTEKHHRASNSHARKPTMVASSSSSSDYSDDSEVPDSRNIPLDVSSIVKRRSATPSKGGADKRRIAIVQMDSVTDDQTRNSTSSTSETSSVSSGSLQSRRANPNNLAGLALVAPPDAAVNSYTHLTPPSSAPVTADYRNHSHLIDYRRGGSASESPADRDKMPSRDGIVDSVGSVQGTRTPAAPFPSANNGKTINTKAEGKHIPPALDALQSSANSPSSSVAKPSDRAGRGRNVLSPFDKYNNPASMSPVQVLTPSIGEGKQIDTPVAGPIVVKLDNAPPRTSHSSTSWRSDSPTPSHGSASIHGSTYSSSATSSYLRYEPGVHATAGPLPPPPRAMFNIDISSPPPPRPPRLHSPTSTPTNSRIRGDIEAVKQALQLPPSVSAVLAAKLSTPPPPSVVSRVQEEEKPIKEPDEQREEDVVGMQKKESQEQPLTRSTSVHRREAATLSDSFSSDDSSVRSVAEDNPSSKTSADNRENSIAVTVVAPSTDSTALPSTTFDHSKFDKWLNDNPELSRLQESQRNTSFDERRESPERSMSPSSRDGTNDAPSPPPKSLRTSLTNNLRRFSALPRTPSLSSRSERRASGSTRYSSSRTPSPSIPLSPRPAFKKIKSNNPPALFCHEVYSQNTTLQRCAIYAAKINELYIHDCGLMEWVDDSKTRGSNTHSQRGPSTKPFTPQPRQTSRSSIISDATFATFPIRPDASMATDLLQGAYRDITPPGMPPLPYPSLAINPPASSRPMRSQSTASSATATSIRSLAPTPSLKGGFFASLGRKASISSSRKEKYLPTISNPVTLSVGLPGRSTSKQGHTSAQLHRPNNGSNHSAPGGPRAPPQRAQRSQTFMASVPSYERSGNADLGRRPSLFNLNLDPVLDIQADPEFAQQVDKLHTLLPQADRDILAGYLRHAGQDMLAIGQYLEDERMGTIQRF